MKAILELNDDDFDIYTHALGYYLILDNIENKLRSRMKYEEIDEKAYAELDSLRTFIYEQKQQYHLPND